MEVVLGRERGDEERDEYDDDEWKQGVVDWGSSGPFQATSAGLHRDPGRAQGCTGSELDWRIQDKRTELLGLF